MTFKFDEIRADAVACRFAFLFRGFFSRGRGNHSWYTTEALRRLQYSLCCYEQVTYHGFCRDSRDIVDMNTTKLTFDIHHFLLRQSRLAGWVGCQGGLEPIELCKRDVLLTILRWVLQSPPRTRQLSLPRQETCSLTTE